MGNNDQEALARWLSEQEEGIKDKKIRDPYDLHEYKLEDGEEALIWILKPAGDGSPFRRTFHWPPGGMKKECTRRTFGKCVYCHYGSVFEEETAEVRPRPWNPFRAQDSWAVEVIDFRWFHRIPTVLKGNVASYTLRRCTAPSSTSDPSACRACALPEPELSARTFGGLKIFEMDRKNAEALSLAHQQLRTICHHGTAETGGCGAALVPVSVHCRKCGISLGDYSKSEVQKLQAAMQETDVRLECLAENCKTIARPEFGYECPSGQHTAVPGAYFGKLLGIRNKAVQLRKRDGTQFSEPRYSYDIGQGPAHLADLLTRVGIPEEVAAGFLVPRDIRSTWFRPERLSESRFSNPAHWEREVLAEQVKALTKNTKIVAYFPGKEVHFMNPWAEKEQPLLGLPKPGDAGANLGTRFARKLW